MNSFYALSGSLNIFKQMGLVSYYKFDDTLLDMTGYADLSRNGGISTVYVTGKKNKALYCNGYDVMTSSSTKHAHSIYKPLSYSFWAKANIGIYRRINDQNESGFSIVSYGSETYWGIGPAQSIVVGVVYGETPYTYNTWRFIVATYDGSQLSTGFKFYVNGDLITPSGYEGESISDELTYTGRFNVNSPTLIDELAIYNKALTQADVTALYNSGTGLFY